MTAMHAGLIPVVTRETSVDVNDFGFMIRDATIDDVANSIREVASLPPHEVGERSRKAWQYARSMHTRENFAATYRRVVAEILGARSPEKFGGLPDPAVELHVR